MTAAPVRPQEDDELHFPAFLKRPPPKPRPPKKELSGHEAARWVDEKLGIVPPK